MVGIVQPGGEFGEYLIEAVEREDANVAVLRATEREGRVVTLHVAGAPPGSLETVRFLERAHRLGSVDHPHLLGIYDTRTLEGRAVAVAEAPDGRRLDEVLGGGPLGVAAAVRIARQVASAVDALEEAGAPPPPLTAERIWVDARGDARLDGLDTHLGLALPAASSSASLADLLGDMVAHTPAELETVLTRARDGAYLSAGQFAEDLQKLESGSARRRRDTALTIMGCATLMLLIVLIVAFG
jgi:hypothetical protein